MEWIKLQNFSSTRTSAALSPFSQCAHAADSLMKIFVVQSVIIFRSLCLSSLWVVQKFLLSIRNFPDLLQVCHEKWRDLCGVRALTSHFVSIPWAFLGGTTELPWIPVAEEPFLQGKEFKHNGPDLLGIGPQWIPGQKYLGAGVEGLQGMLEFVGMLELWELWNLWDYWNCGNAGIEGMLEFVGTLEFV